MADEYVVDVEHNLNELLSSQDTTNDGKITVLDQGSKVCLSHISTHLDNQADDHIKVFKLATSDSKNGPHRELKGTYQLSSLLQELSLAQKQGLQHATIKEERLNESPVQRLSRFIDNTYWVNLTRCLDHHTTISAAANDPKDWTSDPKPRIYIPKSAPEQYEYYSEMIKTRPDLHLEVDWLPEIDFTAQSIRELNRKPGLLALHMEPAPKDNPGDKSLIGVPFVVPGGRFNELYGWDSYFCCLGLLTSGKTDLAKAVVKNFTFEILNYGKILNANRSYYLCRSQPPFLTDLALRTYALIKDEPGAEDFLREAILAAMKEYNDVWVSEPRLDPVTGLSRYRPDGHGVPMETEHGHFMHVLMPYAEKHGLTYDEFVAAYNNEEIHEPELDEYFLHDRAVRESGHDTSARFNGSVAADLATIDLNCLLYKYETDIASTIEEVFNNELLVPTKFCPRGQKEHVESSREWKERAARRKERIDTYLWNEEKGMYFDYNTKTKQQTDFETVTTLWVLWSEVASSQQASKLVERGLPQFEHHGGLSSTSQRSSCIDGAMSQRQWDFPNGWAPHQIMAWDGLQKYGFDREAKRLTYRWLSMIIKVFMDYNGTVVEKYNVTAIDGAQKVDAEYGNQGCDFRGVPLEGYFHFSPYGCKNN